MSVTVSYEVFVIHFFLHIVQEALHFLTFHKTTLYLSIIYLDQVDTFHGYYTTSGNIQYIQILKRDVQFTISHVSPVYD